MDFKGFVNRLFVFVTISAESRAPEFVVIRLGEGVGVVVIEALSVVFARLFFVIRQRRYAFSVVHIASLHYPCPLFLFFLFPTEERYCVLLLCSLMETSSFSFFFVFVTFSVLVFCGQMVWWMRKGLVRHKRGIKFL